MPQLQKYKEVMSVIERRIRSGDYVLHPIPSERRIAEETGVSHMTARKAVLGLLERNVLVRRANGALEISPSHRPEANSAQILLLYPAYPSAYLTHLCQVVSEAAEQYGLSIRPVQYVHWDDPVVVSVVSHPSGTILIPSSFDVPEHILATLRANKGVALDLDLSDRGIPSIRLFPRDHITHVFAHLQLLGHRRIDCLSTHVHNPEIERRVALWRNWIGQHGLAGELHEHAAPSFGDPMPFAREVMKRILNQSGPKATAFVGTTFPAAVGAVRACWEHGLAVGKDVSVCAINIESPARFMTPSITGLDTPDMVALLRHCFEWFTADRAWKGPLCLEPQRAEFFTGESTAAAE